LQKITSDIILAVMEKYLALISSSNLFIRITAMATVILVLHFMYISAYMGI